MTKKAKMASNSEVMTQKAQKAPSSAKAHCWAPSSAPSIAKAHCKALSSAKAHCWAQAVPRRPALLSSAHSLARCSLCRCC